MFGLNVSEQSRNGDAASSNMLELQRDLTTMDYLLHRPKKSMLHLTPKYPMALIIFLKVKDIMRKYLCV